MVEPSIVLGVPLMDRDHAVLEALLALATETEDADLTDLLKQVEAETRAHFEREEAMMQEQVLPVFLCHAMQHEILIGLFQQAHGAIGRDDSPELRRFLTDILPVLLLRHMNTADRVTASMLKARPRPV